MAISYPSTLPLPDTYSGAVSWGLLRSEGGGSELEQRTSFNSARTDFSMTFSMDNSTYYDWYAWIKSFGYDWFEMMVVSNRLPLGPIESFQRIRIVGPVQYSKRGDNWLSVTVQAEMIPGDV